MSLEVQKQVNRDLERILKQPSFVIQRSVITSEEVMNNSDEEHGQSPSVCESELYIILCPYASFSRSWTTQLQSFSLPA